MTGLIQVILPVFLVMGFGYAMVNAYLFATIYGAAKRVAPSSVPGWLRIVDTGRVVLAVGPAPDLRQG